MELSQIRACPQVIALAGGAEKRNAIRGAMAGGLHRCADHRLADGAEFAENGFRLMYRMGQMKLIPILVLSLNILFYIIHFSD